MSFTCMYGISKTDFGTASLQSKVSVTKEKALTENELIQYNLQLTDSLKGGQL